MKFWRAVCLISVGGFVESELAFAAGDQWKAWLMVIGVSACGWAWAAIGDGLRRAATRLLYAFAGRPQPLPATDPQAMAAEIAALNRQIASLRDTATSFDVSFDETLQRLDERLRRMEQQAAYVQSQILKPGV